MSSDSKKGNPCMHFLFLSKSPSKQTPSNYPNRAPAERAARLEGLFFYSSLKFLIKYSLNIFFSSLKGPRKGAFLHIPQIRGPCGNIYPFPEPYLAYSLGSTVKEPSFQVPLIDLPRRETPHS
jgi:hypothetical protein